MRRIGVFAVILVIAGALLAVTGCATARGLGQDVQSLGRGIENVSE
ncbi:MAG TPA: entericidin A/B family lipoprotein [bacterium]|mgnify:FL=1|jgi:predicted small secreted protein|nr:entericidin A/B family lipoprotein [bacterium]HQL62896.1 entericidin A/B family lipoprotein [bacterium]